jgi:PhnB protein
MSITGLNPYVSFNGNAEKAIKHYENALGAKVQHVMRWSEAPNNECPGGTPVAGNGIMHAVLAIGGGVLMLADSPPNAPKAGPGSNVAITLQLDSVEELDKKFSSLARDGQVICAPENMFWGGRFGMLVDAFGVQWQLHCDLKKA